MKRFLAKVFTAMMLVLVISLALSAACFAANTTGNTGLGFDPASNTNMVAHYNFDGDFTDSSGNGNDGTSVGDISFVKEGEKDQWALFNNGYIDVKSVPALNLGSKFTIAVWVKVDSSMAGNKTVPIISKLDEKGNYNNYHFYARGTFGARLDARFKGGDKSIFNGPFEDYGLSAKWSQLVLSFDGQTLYLYHNGALKATKAIGASDTILASGNKMRIGTGNDLNNSNLFYKGKMDDLRIYDYALSGAEIKTLYNATRPSIKIVLQLDNPKMVVNGVEQEIDSGKGTGPISLNGRTMVPIRAIIEAMGGTVTWIEQEKQLDIKLKINQLKLWVNKTTAQLNGKQLKMEVAPKVINGRTMVPLRFVSENMGCNVAWNQSTRTITILYYLD